MGTKEPEGVFYSLIFEKHPNTYYLGMQKIGKLNITSSKIFRSFDFLQIYEEKSHSLNGIRRIS
ncbi:MAG: hypothetical protein IJ582_02780 [Prevotella sp.]|nr:hypothetical protein [Prevotella sp.]